MGPNRIWCLEMCPIEKDNWDQECSEEDSDDDSNRDGLSIEIKLMKI